MKASVGFFAALAVILTATPLVEGLWNSHRIGKALHRRDNTEAIQVIQSVIDEIPSLVDLIKKTQGLFEKLKTLQQTGSKKKSGGSMKMKGPKKNEDEEDDSEDKPKWWTNVFRLPQGWNIGQMFGQTAHSQAFSYSFR